MSSPYIDPQAYGEAVIPPPAYRLFDPAAVTIATLLGSPIAGTILMAINYRRLGKGGLAALTAIAGVVVTVLAIIFGNFIPYTFSTVAAIGLLLTTRSCAQVFQGPAVGEHVLRGGKLSSRWAAAGIGLGLLVVIFGAVFLVLFSREMSKEKAVEKAKIMIGTQDKVYYSGAATEQDAQALGNKLKEIGYLKDRGVTVFVSRDKGSTVVSFAVKEGAWNDSAMITAFQEIGGEVAPLLSPSGIKVRLVDKSQEIKKEFTAGKVMIGSNDEIFYAGSATDSDARNLGEALKTAGYLEDRGVSVLLSKGEGTIISLVVKEGIWDKPASVEAYQTVVRHAAPSVGGLPITLRLINSSLATKKEMTIQ